MKFDTEKVTSMDWVSHPSLTHMDTPSKIDIVLVNGDPNPNRPDLPHYGGGETICKPLLAAVGILFDGGPALSAPGESILWSALRRWRC